MNILGISAGFHDASITVVNEETGKIIFAGHSERYSGKKNDELLCPELLNEIELDSISKVAYYEDPVAKQMRQCYAGQGIEWNKITLRSTLKEVGLPLYSRNKLCPMGKTVTFEKHQHHKSHAAAGFQTSPFNEATVVVVDAIGEWDSATIWRAEYDDNGYAKYTKLWSQKYPHSLGLFYSAFTQRVGLKPLEEEFIFMGMAAWGENKWFDKIYNDFILDPAELKFKQNLHVGIDPLYLDGALDVDIAASVQSITEHLIDRLINKAKHLNSSPNLVFMGGVALNCVANANIGAHYDNIWVMPNPGDAGSSLGAAALTYGKKLQWEGPFLGYGIYGLYPVNDIIDELLENQIAGVATGRAEFGPRALGHRSLLADPRGDDIKDRVNDIKKRQRFRPFAPMILEEMAEEYFDMPAGWHKSPYMQTVAHCKKPKEFPAIIHIDGTSRVQTIGKEPEFAGVRELLEKWFVLTGCPMLLNTSLNIRGEPMVNSRWDADRFEDQYGIKVLS